MYSESESRSESAASVAASQESGVDSSSLCMIGSSGWRAGAEGSSAGPKVGRVVVVRSFPMPMRVMESTICSCMQWSLTKKVCSSGSGVTSEWWVGRFIGFFPSSVMSPEAATMSRAVSFRGSQSYDSSVRYE